MGASAQVDLIKGRTLAEEYREGGKPEEIADIDCGVVYINTPQGLKWGADA